MWDHGLQATSARRTVGAFRASCLGPAHGLLQRDGRAACWILAAVAIVPLVFNPAAAQVSGRDGEPAPLRRETIIGGTPPQSKFERCIEVEIGGDRALGCLNQQLRREVDRVNPSLNLPSLDARSPDVRVGNVNEAAVRQQYGPNYGRSVYPFRPPAAFTMPRR